ncbi:MAG: DNA cytosine methyltransferase [Candidatus Beckwithbacteria bacterium]|nr:DNA cytosine methyltransferase [Patescibacteria group bacterium]
MKKRLKTVDLFAGIGGIRLGFEEAGFEVVYANDFDKYCKKTYDANSGSVKLTVKDISKKLPMFESSVLSDIKELEYDFLLGGFPCQAFSIAGYREGFNDKKDRGGLFFEIAKIIKETKPKGFLLENVKNLKGHDNGKTFEIIIDTLKHLGYFVKTKVLNSKEYGNVPQNRERIFIVGFKSKKHLDKFKFPEKISLNKKIVDLLDQNVEDKYYYNDKPLYEKLKDYVKKENKVYQWRRKYVRENKNGVCPTLTANMGMGGHNVPIIKDKKGIRKLTPRECARFQGFPDSFVLPSALADSRLYKQIGNSVTVPVVRRVAEEIKITLS